MKKVVMFIMFTVSLIFGGCSQTTQKASENNAAAATKEESNKSDFPNKPIEMIVPFAPGGATDTSARILASHVSKYLPNGQSVVVVNKAGGSGTIGNTEVFQAKPDGYKILFSSTGPTSVQPNYGKTVYTHDSFQPIMRVTSVPQILVVKADAPWKTFKEWLEYVKQNPDKFTYGTAGAGGPSHIAMEALNAAAGIKTKIVPFDGHGPAITAVLGGHVQGALSDPQIVKPQVDSGELRALANLGSAKIETFKDTTVAKEEGFDVAVETFNGLLAPKDLPKEVLDILHDAFKKAIEDPEALEQFKKIGIETSYAGPEDFQKVITNDFETFGKIMKNIGLIK